MPDQSLYGIFELKKPAPDEWQTNDVDLDAWNVLVTQCSKASRLGILDWYLDRGYLNTMSFTRFLRTLAVDKKSPDACEFELVADTVIPELVDAEIRDSILWSGQTADTMESIGEAFAELAAANPPKVSL